MVMTKKEFIEEFERRCSKMETANDVGLVWKFMDKTLIDQGWIDDHELAMKLCRIETEWQAKKKIVTHPESSNLWLTPT